jgi:hypothetical protein
MPCSHDVPRTLGGLGGNLAEPLKPDEAAARRFDVVCELALHLLTELDVVRHHANYGQILSRLCDLKATDKAAVLFASDIYLAAKAGRGEHWGGRPAAPEQPRGLGVAPVSTTCDRVTNPSSLTRQPVARMDGAR